MARAGAGASRLHAGNGRWAQRWGWFSSPADRSQAARGLLSCSSQLFFCSSLLSISCVCACGFLFLWDFCGVWQGSAWIISLRLMSDRAHLSPPFLSLVPPSPAWYCRSRIICGVFWSPMPSSAVSTSHPKVRVQGAGAARGKEHEAGGEWAGKRVVGRHGAWNGLGGV